MGEYCTAHSRGSRAPDITGGTVARRTNYGFEKKQREERKRKKKEEKAQRRRRVESAVSEGEGGVKDLPESEPRDDR